MLKNDAGLKTARPVYMPPGLWSTMCEHIQYYIKILSRQAWKTIVLERFMSDGNAKVKGK